MSDPLQKLFGSAARVKLLRLFLFNPRTTFTIPEVSRRSRVSLDLARKEISLLRTAGVIRRPPRVGARYTLADNFPYLDSLQDLMLNAPNRGEDIAKRLKIPGVKMVIMSGIFVGEWEGRVDLLIAGDRLNELKLRARIRALESELGRDLRYSVLSSSDFLYRMTMNDHLVRDVLDYPHKVVIDRLGAGVK